MVKYLYYDCSGPSVDLEGFKVATIAEIVRLRVENYHTSIDLLINSENGLVPKTLNRRGLSSYLISSNSVRVQGNEILILENQNVSSVDTLFDNEKLFSKIKKSVFNNFLKLQSDRSQKNPLLELLVDDEKLLDEYYRISLEKVDEDFFISYGQKHLNINVYNLEKFSHGKTINLSLDSHYVGGIELSDNFHALRFCIDLFMIKK